VHVLGVHQKEDGVTADEAGASMGKNLAKGKNPKTIDQGTSQKKKVMQNSVLIILFIDSLTWLI